MNNVPVLLIREGPTLTVLIGADEAECRRAADILARWWGAPDGSQRTPGGQRFEVGLAEGLVAPYQVAIVALDAADQVLAIALADDRPSAAFLSRDWGGEATEVRILPAGTVGDVLSQGQPRRDPRVLSTTFCPRCGDHPLHVDPIFDDRSRLDGSRICNGCGLREALKLEPGSSET